MTPERLQILTCFLLVASIGISGTQGLASAQATGGGANQQAAGSNADATTPEYPRVAITQVAQKNVDQTRDITIENLDGLEGEDVKVDSWATPDSASTWVLVNARGSRIWRAYGPAKDEGGGVLVVHGVRIGEGPQQGRYFWLRAVALNSLPPAKEMSISEWRQRAITISDPVRVTVQSRLVQGQAEPLIQISAIDNQTVDPQEHTEVESSAEVRGTLMLSEDAGKPSKDRSLVYVILHTPGTDKWRVARRAEVPDSTWVAHDTLMIDLGEPYQANFEILAVLSRNELSEGLISHDALLENAIALSSAIRIVAKILPVVPFTGRPVPKVTIQNLIPRDSEGEFSDTEQLENTVAVEGEVNPLPSGGDVWLLINPLGSQMWMIHGPAIVREGKWMLPITRSTSPSLRNATHFRLIAIVTTKILSPGLADYNTWRPNALAVSEMKILRNGNTGKRDHSSPIPIFVSKVAGITVSQGSDEQVPNSGDIEGGIESLPHNSFVYVAVHEKGTEKWEIKGPALVRDDDTWVVPDVVFAREPQGGEKTSFKRFEIAALVTDFSFAVRQINLPELIFFAQAISPLVHITDGPGDSISGSSNNRKPIMAFLSDNTGLLMVLFIALLLLTLLEYCFRLVSTISGRLASVGESMLAYLRVKFPWLDEPFDAVSILGVVILGLGLFAIYSYFPLYSHVLESIYSLQPRVAKGLATVLIIFVGLAGLFIHVMQNDDDKRKRAINRKAQAVGPETQDDGHTDAAPRAEKNSSLRFLGLMLLLGVTLALWVFQFLIYSEFYESAAEHSEAAKYLGLAAFFIAGIETLSFYWATRFGLDLIAWGGVGLIIVGPVYVLTKFFELCELGFRSLPSRVAPAKPPRLVLAGLVREGMNVVCEDGKIGRVDGLRIDSSNTRAQHLVVKSDNGTRTNGHLEIPIHWVKRITSDEVLLTRTTEQVEREAAHL